MPATKVLLGENVALEREFSNIFLGNQCIPASMIYTSGKIISMK